MRKNILIQTSDGIWKVIPKEEYTPFNFPKPKKKRKKYSKNEETYTMAMKRANYLCEDCSTPHRIFPHHIDGNHENHELNNLKIVCWHCHSKYLNV